MTTSLPCPTHHTPMRSEWGTDGTGRTWYCGLCATHYPRCTSVRYMEMCQQLSDHTGPHESDGRQWTDQRWADGKSKSEFDRLFQYLPQHCRDDIAKWKGDGSDEEPK